MLSLIDSVASWPFVYVGTDPQVVSVPGSPIILLAAPPVVSVEGSPIFQ